MMRLYIRQVAQSYSDTELDSSDFGSGTRLMAIDRDRVRCTPEHFFDRGTPQDEEDSSDRLMASDRELPSWRILDDAMVE
jgi:hypothetical protein